MTQPIERPRAALVIASLIAVALFSFALARPQYPLGSWPVDFRAFYCAGAAVAEHRDPYRTEPLRTCENETRGFPHGRGLQFAFPAPLPGYALAPFAVLSRLPYPVAAGAFMAGLLASLALTVFLLDRICERRMETIFAALFLQALYAVFLGQIVPIVCAATVAAAYFLTRGRDRLAALAGAIAMLEPHLGLPVCLALFIARPRTRPILAACGAAFAIVSVALLGLAANIEYVRDVLPAHTLSEISNEEQYSLAYLAHLAGLGDRAASAAGTVSYLVMLVGGIVAGRAAAKRTGLAALLVLVPPAFAVFGGPFVHVQQLAIALPAALVLSGARSREGRLPAFAVMLLAVPWAATGFLILNLPVVAGVVFLLATDLFALAPIGAGLAGLASIGILAALLCTLADIPAPAVVPLDPAAGSALAEDGWRRYVEASFHSSILPFLAAKSLGWCGLILIALAAAGFDGLKAGERNIRAARRPL
jgi:hypothetical protein